MDYAVALMHNQTIPAVWGNGHKVENYLELSTFAADNLLSSCLSLRGYICA